MAIRYYCMISTAASAEYTYPAIESFIKNTSLQKVDRFFLIENDKGSSLTLPSLPSKFSVTTNNTPLSFAQNVNSFMKEAAKCAADLYLLNNDLIFFPNWLSGMIAPQGALLSPLSNRELRVQEGPLTLTSRMSLQQYTSHKKEFEKIAADRCALQPSYLQVMALPFFCVRIPYEIYTTVGPFDERFGKGGAEDMDYCIRAALCGFRVLFAQHSFVLHFCGKSTWDGAETAEETKARDTQYLTQFVKKWGEALTQLLIFEDFSVLQKNPTAQKLAELGRFRELFTSLTGSS